MDQIRLSLSRVVKAADGFGIQVSPQLMVSQKTLDALQKARVLGFDVSTLVKAVNIMMYNADASIASSLSDMSQEEYAQTMNLVQNSPPGQYKPPEPLPVAPPVQKDQYGLSKGPGMPIPKDSPEVKQTMERLLEKQTTPQKANVLATKTMAQATGGVTPQLIEFFKLLMDAGFKVDDQTLGRELLLRGISNTQAQVALGLSPDDWNKAISDAAGQMYDTPNETVDVLKKMPQPHKMSPEELEKHKQDTQVQEKEFDQAYPVEQEMVQEQSAPINTPAKPSSDTDIKVHNMGDMMKEFKNQYGEKIKGLPAEVKVAPYGESTGIRIMPESGRGSDVAKGGMLVKAFDSMEDGMVVGGMGGKLVVLTFPNGVADMWDPVKRQVRISAHNRKIKPD